MHSRRDVIAGLTASMVLPAPALADVYCSQFNQRGVQLCESGVRIGAIRTARQKCQNWCWAACIQAIFALRGYDVAQREIVRRVYRSSDCLPANGPQIIGAIRGDWTSRNRGDFYADAEPLVDLQFGVWRQDAGAQVARELAANNPLINGALGHATVVTSFKYLRDAYGRGQPLELTVRDPWPGNPNRRRLSHNEVVGTFFIARVAVS